MIKNSLIRTLVVICALTSTGPVSYGQDKPIKKDLKFTAIPKNVNNPSPNATNQNTWIKYMQEELKKPDYKDMKLVKIAYGNDEDQKSFTETQGLLQAYPNLKGFISPTSVGIAAAARYISTSPYKGKVALTGLGTPVIGSS